jgi:hypothetical protein
MWWPAGRNTTLTSIIYNFFNSTVPDGIAKLGLLIIFFFDA